MKPAIGYAIARVRWQSPQIVAITSYRGMRHWYGRTVSDDVATHGSQSDLLSRHATLEEAQERLRAVTMVRDQYEEASRTLDRSSRNLHHEYDEQMQLAARGEPTVGIPIPTVTWRVRQ